MSEKESKDVNYEKQKPRNIKTKNPRSIQTLFKSIIKPKSVEKDLTIEKTDDLVDLEYQSKSEYIKSKLNFKLLKRNKPEPSKTIIRINEEKRQKEEAKKAETQEAQKTPEPTIEDKKVETEEKTEAEPKVEPEPEPEPEVETKPKPKVEPKAEPEPKKEVAKETESEENAGGLSFTQSLRQQGLINTDEPTAQTGNTLEGKKEPAKKQTKEAPKKEVKEAPKEESNDNLSFTQSLRQQGVINTDEPKAQEAPKQETKTEAPKEEVKEDKTEAKVEDKESDGEVKTFIDLIRSEGLL